MEDIQHSLIQEFGVGYKQFGHSDLMGRIVGFMLTEVYPKTIDEIAEALVVTRTPVIEVLRRLETHNLIRRIWIKGERKHHYIISKNVFHQAGTNLAAQFMNNLEISKKFLIRYLKLYNAAEGDEKEKFKMICERFITMLEFHKASMAAYDSFLESWKYKESAFPKVEDLAKNQSKV